MSIFDTEGGSGRTTDYAGEIVDWFAAENEYGTSLQIHTLLDHPEDFAWMPDGIAKEFFNCGPGWRPENNGATVVHDTKDKFNANTDAGRLFSQLKIVPGAEDAFAGQSPYSREGWIGRKWRWGAVEWKTNSFTGKDGTLVEAKIKVKAMPVEYLGTKGSPASNGHTTEAFDLSTLNLDTTTMDALTKAANTADSFSKFLPAALGLGLDQAVFAVVSNPQTGPQVYLALQALPF